MSTLAEVITARAAAVSAAISFLVIAPFQLALALGAPLGHAAWGGTNMQLPPRSLGRERRRGGVLRARAVIVLGRAGSRSPPSRSASPVGEPGSWLACSPSAHS